MLRLIDFNSLWEIAFAVNAILVYFELTPALESKFKGVNAIGRSTIDELLEEHDRVYVNTYGWKSVLFGYVIWIKRLKIFSVVNSVVALLLIITAGFSPEAEIGWPVLGFIIFVLFTPILVIPGIILYAFPLYKLKCIEEAIQKLIDRENGEPKLKENKSRRYRIAIEYIKLTEFGHSLFVKRNKEFSNEDLFGEFNDL